jgi:6-phosphofructokinase 1
MAEEKPTIGIVVSGGPAPGINGVISALTIEALNHSYRVIGIEDGFEWLCKGNYKHVRELHFEDVTRIYNYGGCILGVSRENPTNKEKMQKVLHGFESLHINYLATIGGDDTAHIANQIFQEAGGKIKIVHIPKTIDNDLPLDENTPTFGFQTARHYGVEIVQNLMEDAMTTRRWYLCVTMGRKAGHLALGIGKAASTPLILIPEEFTSDVPIEIICDIIDGCILKRRLQRRPHGVIVMAEGMIEVVSRNDLQDIKDAPRDPNGNVRYAEINLAKEVSDRIQQRFKKRKDPITIVWKNVGYELRCAPPIPFDCEYTRDLGYAAIQFLIQGNSGAMITIIGGKAIPMKFEDMVDKETKKTKIRMVNIHTESYHVGREYQIRLEPQDLQGESLQKLAEEASMTSEDFVKRYEPVTKNCPYLRQVGVMGH